MTRLEIATRIAAGMAAAGAAEEDYGRRDEEFARRAFALADAMLAEASAVEPLERWAREHTRAAGYAAGYVAGHAAALEKAALVAARYSEELSVLELAADIRAIYLSDSDVPPERGASG